MCVLIHVCVAYTGWNQHPGANVIFTMAGEDATDVFAAFHAGPQFTCFTSTKVLDLFTSTKVPQ